MLGTLTNVAVGSGLKILGYVLSRVIDGFFETLRESNQTNRARYQDATARTLSYNSGWDVLSPFSAWTRRVIAWSFTWAACFILCWFALNANDTVPMLIDRDAGIFGWIVGSDSQKAVPVSKGQMIMNMWPLLEIMFGFYFTKVGK